MHAATVTRAQTPTEKATQLQVCCCTTYGCAALLGASPVQHTITTVLLSSPHACKQLQQTPTVALIGCETAPGCRAAVNHNHMTQRLDSTQAMSTDTTPCMPTECWACKHTWYKRQCGAHWSINDTPPAKCPQQTSMHAGARLVAVHTQHESAAGDTRFHHGALLPDIPTCTYGPWHPTSPENHDTIQTPRCEHNQHTRSHALHTCAAHLRSHLTMAKPPILQPLLNHSQGARAGGQANILPTPAQSWHPPTCAYKLDKPHPQPQMACVVVRGI